MSTEKEKRLHRCCFTGYRPEKLNEHEEEVKRWLEEQMYVMHLSEAQKKNLLFMVR